MISILPLKKYFDQDINYIKSRLNDSVQIISPEKFDEDTLISYAEHADIFLGANITSRLINSAKKLKLIQIPWTGIDTLDFNLLKKIEIPVCNSHSNALAVAEYSIALLLSLMKQIPYHDAKLRAGEWCRPNSSGPADFFPPEKIWGKNVTVWGGGSIGMKIAKMMSGFTVNVTIVVRDERNTDNLPYHYETFSFEKIKEILGATDILFICLPLTNETRGIIDTELFSVMKPSSFIVNTSRGEIIDEDALYQALSKKKIGGAAIDTWYNYPTKANPCAFPSKHYPFQLLHNVILSPHRAGFIKGELPHLDDAIENINRFSIGKPLLNEIDFNHGY